MNHRVWMSPMVLAASLVASGSIYASPTLGVRVPVQAKLGKTKLVSMNLRNDSKQPMKVKAGETEMVLEPGKVTPIKLAEGTTIVAQEATPDRPAGTVITTVNSSLRGATIAVR